MSKFCLSASLVCSHSAVLCPTGDAANFSRFQAHFMQSKGD